MKNLSVILLFSLSCIYLSCQKTTVIEDQSDFMDPLQKRDAVFIKTVDENTYFYQAKTYKLKHDTLYGQAQKVIGLDMMEEPELMEIAYADITEIKTKN